MLKVVKCNTSGGVSACIPQYGLVCMIGSSSHKRIQHETTQIIIYIKI